MDISRYPKARDAFDRGSRPHGVLSLSLSLSLGSDKASLKAQIANLAALDVAKRQYAERPQCWVGL